MMNNDQDNAAAIIAQYRDNMISVIIRHGDINLDQSFNVSAGEDCPLHPLKNGDVVATITSVQVKPYKGILSAEWAKANFRDGDGFKYLASADPNLKDSDPATVITIDLDSLRYRPR